MEDAVNPFVGEDWDQIADEAERVRLERERRRKVLAKYNNSESRKEYMRQWYQANKEHVKAKQAEKAKTDPDRVRGWYRKSYRNNRDKRLEASRAGYHRTKHKPNNLVKELYNSAKSRARNKGLDFSISKQWVLDRVMAGICECTGLPFVAGQGRNGFSPSIDRVDNSKGYTIENSRVILWGVNAFKGEGSHADMVQMARAIVAREDALKEQPYGS